MILTIGSINIDHVYQVQEISRPGETIHTGGYSRYTGGKGLNQSVAAARAGADVRHVGCVGGDGAWLVSLLREEGVDVSCIETKEDATGHAVIQVSREGENSIFIFGGANQTLTQDQLRKAFAAGPPPAYVLLQNETNVVAESMRMAAERGVPIAYNPAPIDADQWGRFPMEQVDVLIVNELEGSALAGAEEPSEILERLATKLPDTTLILTRGPQGVACRAGEESFLVAGRETRVVDTTAAGDTFVGYCLAGIARGEPLRTAVEQANMAAALCVSRAGAAPSIPRMQELREP